MKATFRHYRPYKDSPKVSQFLERTWPRTDRNPNWHRARWEYMVYSAQNGIEEDLAPIGIWEIRDQIVAMVNFEHASGEAYFQVHPACSYLKAEMLGYAETALCSMEGRQNRPSVFNRCLPATRGIRNGKTGHLPVAVWGSVHLVCHWAAMFDSSLQ